MVPIGAQDMLHSLTLMVPIGTPHRPGRAQNVLHSLTLMVPIGTPNVSEGSKSDLVRDRFASHK
jgi:hypothetical protein